MQVQQIRRGGSLRLVNSKLGFLYFCFFATFFILMLDLFSLLLGLIRFLLIDLLLLLLSGLSLFVDGLFVLNFVFELLNAKI